tara:strand:+ start:2416 stop:2973 length:558 start_codon:yes stop_codon:yes gene_type:complete
MKRTWYISDTHFSHRNIIKYCNRPFDNIDMMNERMIQNWNEVVHPDDEVFHLGDVAMGNRRLLPEYIKRLNGRIILIQGNHDNTNSLAGVFHQVHQRVVTLTAHGSIELVHNPIHVKGGEDYAFCGHVHDKWTVMKKGTIVPAYETKRRSEPEFVAPIDIYNVGVDVRGFTPRSFEEIVFGDKRT